MDIECREDIERLVTTFYESAFADELLGPIFVDIAQLDLATHLPTITDFWESVIFKTRAYGGGAFEVHRNLNQKVSLGSREFTRWLELWHAAVIQDFRGPNADLAIRQAQRFAQAFHRRLNNPADVSPIVVTADELRGR